MDLASVTQIALSHGHNDHTRGLAFLPDHIRPNRPALVAHPDALAARRENGVSIGCPVDRSFLEAHYALTLTREPCRLSENILFLGEIPSSTDFERTLPVGAITDADGER
ncbi:MAG: MBL fold metallo-hydrolase, partial [Deltaproteobacteria bacterium]|nr:MBL fold metallo-hydrolase [Deltaproteobacteria bacterium]